MTTPNQGVPPTLETLLGIGAFQIGGGAYQYGQNITQNIINSLIQGPGVLINQGITGAASAISQIAAYLQTLPIEALRMLQAFIPGAVFDDFINVGTAVTTILGAIETSVRMTVDQFTDWITTVYNILLTEVHQILDAIQGFVVTPITARVTGFVDWLFDLDGFRSTTTTDLASALGQIGDMITGSGEATAAALGAALAGAVSDAGSALSGLSSIISNAGEASAAAVGTALAGAVNNLNDLITNSGEASAAALGSAISGTISDLADAVTDIGDLITAAGQSTATAVGSMLAGAANDINDMITGSGEATAAALGAALSGAFTDISSALSQLIALISGAGGGSAGTVGALIATAQSNIASIISNAGAANAAAVGTALSGAVSNLATLVSNSGQANIGAVGTALATAGTNIASIVTNSGAGSAAAAGTAIATAASNLATLISNSGQANIGAVGTAISNAGTNIASIISNAGAANAAAVGTALAGAQTNATSAVNQLTDAVNNAIGGAAAAATSFGSSLQGALTGWFNGWTGAAASTASAASVSSAATNQASNISSQASAIRDLQIGPSMSVGLITNSVDFTTLANGAVPASFTVTSTSAIATSSGGSLTVLDGGVQYSPSGGSGTGYKVCLFNTAPTATDVQTVSAIWSGDFASGDRKLGLVVRSNSAATSLVVAIFSSTEVKTYAIVSGTATLLNTYTLAIPLSPGGKIEVQAGSAFSGVAARYYYIRQNDKTLAIVSDAGNVSQMGASYRYTGFFLQGSNTTSVDLVKIQSFSMADKFFAPGVSATATVATAESTSSASYTDLTTVTDTVTVNIGSGGSALVMINAAIQPSATNGEGHLSFAISGASTVAASDAVGVQYNAYTATASNRMGNTFLMTGLTPGSTTFKMKYFRGGSGSVTFSTRRISVVPL